MYNIFDYYNSNPFKFRIQDNDEVDHLGGDQDEDILLDDSDEDVLCSGNEGVDGRLDSATLDNKGAGAKKDDIDLI